MVYTCSIAMGDVVVPIDLIDAKGEDFRAIEYENPDEVDIVAKLPRHLRLEEGYRVKPAGVPNKLRWGHSRCPLPDCTIMASTPIVDDKFMSVVEALEPGVHQFIPVDFYHRKQTEPFARRYWFVIGKLLDTLDEERTTYELRRNKTHPEVGTYVVEGDGKFVFCAEKVGSHHCWRERYGHRVWHMSEKLVQRVREGGIAGLHFVKRETV